ncbi:hypothetical protein GCM10011401_04540 [Nesterenkonia cremea]|uniref:Uncharacterized protein n=1 Tax=Nesterenkonia cremea TaxID=1882340 RepID=A0A917AMY6_9MICC|nr:hypothetical protein GCM10011401_04540 [Nesterenkonia cremea]
MPLREVEGAYYGGYHCSLFCLVEDARRVIVEEDIDLDTLVESLPDWATTDSRDGEPVLLYVSETSPNVAGERADQIEATLEDFGASADREAIDACIREAGQGTIEEVEGPYRGPV